MYTYVLTILVDNNTITDKYFLGEPALSIFIETKDIKILFDTGYSDVFLKNAAQLGKDIKNIDYIVLSHGHNDHTGGLQYLLDFFKYEKHKPEIIACPNIFNQRYDDIDGDFGCPVEKKQLESIFNIKYTKEPYFITENIVFLGEIPRISDFEAKKTVGLLKDTNIPDFVFDDSAVALKTDNGIVVITGCSHSGIVNICEYAKQVFKTEKIHSIIGGLHLKDVTQKQLNKTVDYFKTIELESLYACHCSGFQAQCQLNSVTKVKETGSGLEISF